LTRRQASQLAQGGRENETAGIKSEIERTRVEMSETLGEIQERLRPDHLIRQARDTVTEAAAGKVRDIMHSAGETAHIVADRTQIAGRSVASYARSHPVQMALVAGGITWWMLRGADRSDEWEGASEGWQGDSDSYAYGEDRSLRDTVGEYATSARETVGEYAESARSTARQASGRAREAAHHARIAARQRWQQAGTSVDDWVHHYPLAAGALAVAAGAAIALSVPSTEVENRAMGETRDQAWEKASRKARELRDNVTEKVQDVADTAIDSTGGARTPPAAPADPTSGRA
jgi:ElaB/YqjD/DUF883 family membrane-anchored ribosome-binding protein